MRSKARVHHYINLLMEFSEGHIVDPSTENPWPFRLPRSSFPAQPDKQFVDVSVPAMRATWEELRPEILEKRRSQAIDNGKLDPHQCVLGDHHIYLT